MQAEAAGLQGDQQRVQKRVPLLWLSRVLAVQLLLHLLLLSASALRLSLQATQYLLQPLLLVSMGFRCAVRVASYSLQALQLAL